MSAAAARVTHPTARSAVTPAGTSASRSGGYLRLVATRRSYAAKAPFVAVVVGILALGLLALLLLNTVLAQDAFRLHALQVQSRLLADQEQGLHREVEQLLSPQSLAARAAALGMVPGGTPAFLRLSDGKILGAAMPGAAPVAAPTAPTVLAAPGGASAPGGAPAAKPKPAAPAAGGWVLVPTPAHKTSGGHR